MPSFHDITADQLRQIIHLRERIEFLQEILRKLRSDAPTKLKRKVGRPPSKRRIVPAATIKKMRAGQQPGRGKIKGKPASGKSASAK